MRSDLGSSDNKGLESINPLNSQRTFTFIGETEFNLIEDIQSYTQSLFSRIYKLRGRYFICIHNYTKMWYIVHSRWNVEEWKGNSNVWEVTDSWDDDIKCLKRYINMELAKLVSDEVCNVMEIFLFKGI